MPFNLEQIKSFANSDEFLSLIAGFILGFFTIYLTGFSKEFFDERKRKKEHKINVARQIVKICNEASTGNFRNALRDKEHVNSVLIDVEGFDKKIEKTMNSFINIWGRIIEISQGNKIEDEKHYLELLRDIEKKRKILISWANKIRAGR